jgi:Zn-dependent peptidase ImmA (M78 family)
MEDGICDELCAKFKVKAETCGDFDSFYTNTLLKKVQKKYLAHLVASIEEMINDGLKDKSKYEESIDSVIKNTRRFSIILFCDNINGGAKTYRCNNGALIVYNPRNKDKDIRVLIAHELGHIVNEQRKLPNTENNANLFAFFALSGKNKFYQSKYRDFFYPSDNAIIRDIARFCPVTTFDQKSESLV